MPELPASLVYVSDRDPGIRRIGAGRGFYYRYPDGTKISDRQELGRIKALAVPPAYREVWICARAEGHLQATGRDDRGRKQYRYHPEWQAWRNARKFGQLSEFADCLPRLRRRVARDLRRPGMPREKVLAVVVRLMEASHIRVGNEQYAEENDSYGVTTFREEHVEVHDAELEFSFIGKSGREHHSTLRDQRLAKLVSRLQDLPGQHLFQYREAESGAVRPVDSADVNAYLAEILPGKHFTAKIFRTWAGTVLSTRYLWQAEAADSRRERERQVVAAVKATAAELRNRPATCRKYYIHPAVLDSYVEDGWERRRRAYQGERQTERFFEHRTAEILQDTQVISAA